MLHNGDMMTLASIFGYWFHQMVYFYWYIPTHQIPSPFYFTFHLLSFDWHERMCTITCSTDPQCYAVYKGSSPELNTLPVLSLSFPLSLSKSCNDKTAPMTTTPMCSSLYAKFLVSMVMGHHCPFSLSLLFGSTNLFMLHPCQGCSGIEKKDPGSIFLLRPILLD